MKTIGIIVLVVILSIVAGIAYIGLRVKKLWDNVTINWKLNESLTKLLSDLAQPISYVDVSINIILDNNSKEKVDLKDFTDISLKAYYNNVLIGENIKDNSLNNILLHPLEKQKTIPTTIRIYKNNETTKLIGELIKKSQPVIQLLVNAKYKGIEINKTNKKFNYTLDI